MNNEKKNSKVKVWFNKNWPWIVGGVASVGTAIAVVMSCDISGKSTIDPLVIDKGKDDWMDQLTVPFDNKKITVRQCADFADYSNKLLDHFADELKETTLDTAVLFSCKYSETYPEKWKRICEIYE